MEKFGDAKRLSSVGKMAACRAEAERLGNTLERVQRWRPAGALRAQAAEAGRILEELRERLERKLVVSVIGPSGAGKSTLVNALAGIDGLSPSGDDRPTTREVIVICRDRADADDICGRLDGQSVRVEAGGGSLPLEHIVLVDTPDVDSNMCPKHRPIVEAVIGLSDVLICVFHSENPKRRDSIDFLVPFVRQFPGESVYAVLNHCDRQDEGELRQDILPDFERHLERAWQRDHQVLCTSARRHLHSPDWGAGEEPRHAFDQFDTLRDQVLGSIDRASRVVDVRMRRAEYLIDFLKQAAAGEVGKCSEALEQAKHDAGELEDRAFSRAINRMAEGRSGITFGVNTLLYQRLAERWWGPTGWLVALWARLTVFGTGLMNVFRFGRPIRQLWGAVSSALRWRDSQSAVENASIGRGLEPALAEYRMAIQEGWPEIAERLIAAGFDESVREPGAVLARDDALTQVVLDAWESGLKSSIETAARRISGIVLQLILNLPVIALAGVIGYHCVAGFIAGEYLSADYFRHAFVTLLIVWLLPFVFFQFLVRLVGGERLVRRTMKGLMGRAEEQTGGVVEAPILEEIDVILSIGHGNSESSRNE